MIREPVFASGRAEDVPRSSDDLAPDRAHPDEDVVDGRAGPGGQSQAVPGRERWGVRDLVRAGADGSHAALELGVFWRAVEVAADDIRGLPIVGVMDPAHELFDLRAADGDRVPVREMHIPDVDPAIGPDGQGDLQRPLVHNSIRETGGRERPELGAIHGMTRECQQTVLAKNTPLPARGGCPPQQGTPRPQGCEGRGRHVHAGDACRGV
jgi:hypothetical protein